MNLAVRSFAAVAARVRAVVWPITVALPDESEVEVAKASTKVERVQQEQGAGYVTRSIATFNFPASGEFVPRVGDQWTITASELADEVGTVWRCFDIIRSVAGSEHRCVCFKLD
jgi:hypothetical protein